MSGNRFLLIQQYLRFARNQKTHEKKPSHKIYAVHLLITHFNEIMNEIYYPGREITLDETMFPWPGRLVYITNKKHIKMIHEKGGKGHTDREGREHTEGPE